jgi:hypothetical protein
VTVLMLSSLSRRLAVGVAVVSAAVALSVQVPSADGAVKQPHVVSATPAAYTPDVVDGNGVLNAAVDAFTQIGPKIYAGGNFHTVQDVSGQSPRTLWRQNLFSFNGETGAVKAFHPNINGTVWALASDRTALWVGGDFTRINGAPCHAIAELNPVTGVVRKRFQSPFTDGRVTDIRLVRGKLIVSGTFPQQLASLNPRTGARTGYIHARISGQVTNRYGKYNSGPTEVYKFAVSPDRRRLVAVGNFTSVDRQTRYRAFMLDLGKRSTRLDRWHYGPLRHPCRAAKTPDQLRGVDFSPQGGYFVIVATGWVPLDRYRFTSHHRPGNTEICDAVASFKTNVAAPKKPTWINYTGGDSLYSVAATGPAVYVQGHERWLNNPYGVNSPGRGAKYRPGIGAVNPGTGLARRWNPTKSRDVGGKVLFATRAGLWVGSDGPYFAGAYHDSIAFCPIRHPGS